MQLRENTFSYSVTKQTSLSQINTLLSAAISVLNAEKDSDFINVFWPTNENLQLLFSVAVIKKYKYEIWNNLF